MKKVVIIGGGIAGLSAGIYAQMNGFESVIIEKNTVVGGECIGWQREGCYIDGCIHWLTGSNRGGLNEIWKTVGALDGVKIIEPEYLYQYIDGETVISVHRDTARFKTELLDIAPEDSEQIEEFIGYVESMKGMSMPLDPIDQMNLLELMKLGKSMMPMRKVMQATATISIGEYADRFKNETLRKFMLSYMPPAYQFMSFVVSLATFMDGNGNIPAGSSMDFTNRMRDKYLSLGGKIKLNTTVSDIKITKKNAEQVITTNGDNIRCDYIIPACDADVTYHKLLKRNYNDKAFENRYCDEANNPLMANCYFAYSIDQEEARKLPHMLMMECEGIDVCGKQKTLIGLKVYDYIENRNGRTTAISPLLQCGADFDEWEKLYTIDQTKYKAEKTRIGEEIKNKFIERYPNLEGKIKLIDSATPITYARYLGAYKGAYMSFMLTKKSKQLMHSGKIKGLKNCFMAGQWLITPGGLPTAVVTGKFAVQRICKAEKLIFKD